MTFQAKNEAEMFLLNRPPAVGPLLLRQHARARVPPHRWQLGLSAAEDAEVIAGGCHEAKKSSPPKCCFCIPWVIFLPVSQVPLVLSD